jgi:hypothetical protein
VVAAVLHFAPVLLVIFQQVVWVVLLILAVAVKGLGHLGLEEPQVTLVVLTVQGVAGL